MTLKLCEKLNMKPDEVYKMNYIGVLNWLSVFKNIEDVNNNK